MSEPTYRITTEHKPDLGKIIRGMEARSHFTDGESRFTPRYGDDRARLTLEEVSRWIKEHEAPRQAGGVYFATEDGELDPPLIPEPQSIRA